MTFILTRAGSPRVEILDTGATINSVRLIPDDPRSEVGVNFTDAARVGVRYCGTVVGRYANRIADGEFNLNGHHTLSANEGTTTLHGGLEGFDSQVWTRIASGEDFVDLMLVSPDGDQGFPGELTAHARYSLIDDGLVLELRAVSTRDTYCALTSHAYWNLKGYGTINDHLITVDADEYCPVGAGLLPLGVSAPVAATALDLRSPTRIGDAVRSPDAQIGICGGIDHSFLVRGVGLRRHCRVVDPMTSRTLEVWSDAPASQLYTGNALDGSWLSVRGRVRQGDAFAIEPGVYPDAPHQPWANQALLRTGETWTRRIEWHFGQA